MIQRAYQKIITRFRDIYGSKGNAKLFFAPGRITVMGEHTDYNGGSILSAAVERGTYIVARKRNDNKVNICVHLPKSKKNFLLDSISIVSDDDMWLKCIKGVLLTALEEGHSLTGMDIYLHGDLPYNTSLASSSSLCACALLTTLIINNVELPSEVELAKLSYKAEITHASQKTSLHTHVAIFASKKGNLTLYNSKTEEISHVPFSFNTCSLIVINSNKKRSIADSEYNSRKRECANALKKIKEKKSSINFICDIANKDLKNLIEGLTAKEQRRVSYLVEEHERVSHFIKAIEKSKVKDLGKELAESHKSLQAKYEVSSAELDILVEECLSMAYVHGAKMIGLGFGGGVLAVIQKEMVEEFIENLYVKYKEATRRDSDAYILNPSDGAKFLDIED